jgi:hypothetical protein
LKKLLIASASINYELSPPFKTPLLFILAAAKINTFFPLLKMNFGLRRKIGLPTLY